MTQLFKDSFLDLERHRQLLEQNIEKLRKSLQHWQTWSAEYEGLKEEVLTLRNPSPQDLLRLTETYEGDLVTASEILEILGIKTGNDAPRNAEQIVNILDRRLDYVGQNVNTVEQQLKLAETKLEKAAVVGRPEVMNEDGMPLMEIFEELDEDGNVVEGRVEAHGNNKGLLEEVLRKAGVKDLPATNQTNASNTVNPADIPVPEQPSENVHAATQKPASSRKVQAISVKDMENPGESANVLPDQRAIRDAQHEAAKLEGIMQRAADLNDPIKDPVIPLDESPEDAQLRQDMLKYGMSEIGAVVAELDFEDESEFSDEGFDQTDEDAESLDGEDAFGRSTGTVINDDLRAEMRALEAKLGVRMMHNVGSAPDLEPDVLENEAIKPTKAVDNTPLEKSASPESIIKNVQSGSSTKKGVRFAKDLDISPAPDAISSNQQAVKERPSMSIKAPVSDIVERAPLNTTAADQPPSEPTRRVSRFKANRTTTPVFPPNPAYTIPLRTREVPTGPAGTTLADEIVEKPTPDSPDVPEPDMLDPALLQQEVATEYYRKRNLIISKQGGYKDHQAEDEERTGIVPLTEEEGGKKKLSRFMAARLARE